MREALHAGPLASWSPVFFEVKGLGVVYRKVWLVGGREWTRWKQIGGMGDLAE